MLTNDNGEFTLGGLAPGTYDLSFSWRFNSPKRLRIDNLSEANLICGRNEGGGQVELAVGFKEQVCIPGGLIISFETRWQRTKR